MPDDIVLVTVDSLRADHCGWLGMGADLTPCLDGLAGESVTYTSAVAPGPRTFSSVPESLTGEPLSVAERPITSDDDRIRRMKSHMTTHESLAERVREAGYTTVAFTANPWTSADASFDRGFDEFTEVGREGGEIHDLFRETSFARPARLFDHWLHRDRWFSQWRTFYDDILRTVEDVPEPVFAWVFLLDAHNPYFVPRADRDESSTFGMYSALYRSNQFLRHDGSGSTLTDTISEETLEDLRAAYRDSVRSVDAFVERLVGDLNDVVVVFHSDHGEAFGEHGSFGHQSVLYEENVHVPLLIHGTDTALTVDAPVSTRAIPDLITAFAHDETLDPEAVATDTAIARTLDDEAIAARGSRWKYIRTTDDEVLFDLRDDPNETTDVGDEHPAVRDRLRGQCEAFLDRIPRERASESEFSGTQEMKEHLRSLGYAGE